MNRLRIRSSDGFGLYWIFFSFPHDNYYYYFTTLLILYYMALDDRMSAQLERIWKLERLRNTTETLSQYIKCPDQE